MLKIKHITMSYPKREVVSVKFSQNRYNGFGRNRNGQLCGSNELTLSCGHTISKKASIKVPKITGCYWCWTHE